MHHILIVEDEPIIRSALRRLLERNTYQVSEAGSVQEAQERYNIQSFDLICFKFHPIIPPSIPLIPPITALMTMIIHGCAT